MDERFSTFETLLRSIAEANCPTEQHSVTTPVTQAEASSQLGGGHITSAATAGVAITEANDWVYRVERYFAVVGLNEKEEKDTDLSVANSDRKLVEEGDEELTNETDEAADMLRETKQEGRSTVITTERLEKDSTWKGLLDPGGGDRARGGVQWELQERTGEVKVHGQRFCGSPAKVVPALVPLFPPFRASELADEIPPGLRRKRRGRYRKERVKANKEKRKKSKKIKRKKMDAGKRKMRRMRATEMRLRTASVRMAATALLTQVIDRSSRSLDLKNLTRIRNPKKKKREKRWRTTWFYGGAAGASSGGNKSGGGDGGGMPHPHSSLAGWFRGGMAENYWVWKKPSDTGPIGPKVNNSGPNRFEYGLGLKYCRHLKRDFFLGMLETYGLIINFVTCWLTTRAVMEKKKGMERDTTIYAQSGVWNGVETTLRTRCLRGGE